MIVTPVVQMTKRQNRTIRTDGASGRTDLRGNNLDWGKISRRKNLSGLLYRTKMNAVLEMVDKVCAKQSSKRALEVGCGPGYLTVALAQRGLFVDAMESVPAVARSADLRANRQGVGSAVGVHVGDFSNLRFRNSTFDLIVALPVLPWFEHPRPVIRKMLRLLKPRGCMLLAAHNRWQLGFMLDPTRNPLVMPVREWFRKMAEKSSLRRPLFRPALPVVQSPGEVKALLSEFQMNIVDERTIGFGPITAFGKHVVPDFFGRTIQKTLQHCADYGVPVLKWMGSQYVVLSSNVGLPETSVPGNCSVNNGGGG